MRTYKPTQAAAVLALLFVSCSAQKLNPYTGELKDLLPSKVGAYNRGFVRPQGRTPETKFEEGLGATYKNSTTNQSLELLALNFVSAEKAREGWHDYEHECQGSGGRTRDESAAKKSTFGKILVCEGVSHPGLAWTNGSVLFIIFGDADGVTPDKALAFEREFPF